MSSSSPSNHSGSDRDVADITDIEDISDMEEDINTDVEDNTDAEDATDVDGPATSGREGDAPPPYPIPRRNAGLPQITADELRERAKATRLARFDEYAAKRRTLWGNEWALLQTTKEVVSIGYAAAAEKKKLSDELWVSSTVWTQNRAKWWGVEFHGAERCRRKFLRDANESSKRERKEMKQRWNELEKECGLLRDVIIDKKGRPGHLNVERWEKYGDEVVYGLLRERSDARRIM